jgi:hypothetical protein
MPAPAAAASVRTTGQEWFVTCQFARYQLVGREIIARPSTLAHAKRMGTLTAACGAPTTNWVKLWDVPFPIAGAECCLKCLEAAYR